MSCTQHLEALLQICQSTSSRPSDYPKQNLSEDRQAIIEVNQPNTPQMGEGLPNKQPHNSSSFSRSLSVSTYLPLHLRVKQTQHRAEAASEVQQDSGAIMQAGE